MSTFTADYSEAHSRPSEAAHDAMMGRIVAKARAKREAEAADRAAAKRAAAILATDNTMVAFTPVETNMVSVRTSGRDPARCVYSLTTVTLSLDEARAEYRRLLAAGYYRW